MNIFKVGLKVILAMCLIAGLIGCEIGHPIPPEAFKVCSDQGGSSVYKSNHNGTRFVCVPPGGEFEGRF